MKDGRRARELGATGTEDGGRALGGEGEALEVQPLLSLAAISAAEWDALVGADDPFCEHAFLYGLEQSACVGPAPSGWQSMHLIARQGSRVFGALPLYLKTDSFGEYIFDWGWAEAAERAGIAYYPKLVAAVPFTPAGSSRLLLAPQLTDPRRVAHALLRAARELAEQLGAGSIHLLFCSAQECAWAEELGFASRLSYQFHWRNAGYRDFDGFLAAFHHRGRKALRRDRRIVAASGTIVERVAGAALGPAHWEALYRFYRSTTDRKWGRAYLNRAFFDSLAQHHAHRVVGLFAREGPSMPPIAGALCLEKGDTLYGRYWGALVERPALHFELCYATPIAHCIEGGLLTFEAGAQGQHKLKRGLAPELRYSAHYIAHPGLRRAVAAFLAHEQTLVEAEVAELRSHLPFRQGES